jgi:hypothetical protein
MRVLKCGGAARSYWAAVRCGGGKQIVQGRCLLISDHSGKSTAHLKDVGES